MNLAVLLRIIDGRCLHCFDVMGDEIDDEEDTVNGGTKDGALDKKADAKHEPFLPIARRRMLADEI